MAIQIQSQVLDSIKVYRITVRLTSITTIPDPVAYVSQPEVWIEVLAIAGLPDLLFVAAVLIDQGMIGLENWYDLEMTFDHTHVTATGHQHDRATLFLPLRESYRDGPYIDLATNLGPVDIYSENATVDHLRVRRYGGDDFLFINKEGHIQLGQHVRFLRDCEFDIGTVDGGTTLRRPRDVRVCRDVHVGNDLTVGNDGSFGNDLSVTGDGSFGGGVLATHYGFTQQTSNPDNNPAHRHIYWNVTDNTLRGWDGSAEFILGTTTPTGLTGIYGCPPTVVVGDVVAITGASFVDKADATILGQRPVIGICISKTAPTVCVVQLYGECGVFAGSLTANQLYFLSQIPGTMTTNTGIFNPGDTVQMVGISKSTSVLTLRFESRVLY